MVIVRDKKSPVMIDREVINSRKIADRLDVLIDNFYNTYEDALDYLIDQSGSDPVLLKYLQEAFCAAEEDPEKQGRWMRYLDSRTSF